jgi:NADH-quinone oxidoreductase subunit C
MTREQILTDIQELFKEDIIGIFDKYQKRVYVDIKPESIVKIARYIYKNLRARFNIATGLDVRYNMEIIYHFTIEDMNLLISLRVILPKDKKLKIDSLTGIFAGADWIEREIHEMLGIDFVGHPDLRKLLLSDDWPDGVYPLRCDYKEWDDKAIRDRGV